MPMLFIEIQQNAICQENVVKITGSQLYELLYPTFKPLDGWETLVLSEEHKTLIAQYWEHIPHDNNDTNRFGIHIIKILNTFGRMNIMKK